MSLAIHIHPADNVAVALQPIAKGTAVALPDLGLTVVAAGDIPQGHKLAVRPIAAGENAVKYGFPIGHATAAIAPGAWVHTHNLATNLSGTVEYAYRPAARPLPPQTPGVFSGYRRADGPRGHPQRDLGAAHGRLRQRLRRGPRAGKPGPCHRQHRRSVRLPAPLRLQPDRGGPCPHPQAAGRAGPPPPRGRRAGALARLRKPDPRTVEAELGPFGPARVKFLTCQDVPDEMAAGRALLKELAAHAAQARREPLPVSELVVGLKCGGSDGLSGVTANPVIGRFSDALCACGGTAILTEVPEMFGAEGFLMDRCQTRAVFDKAAAMLNGFKDYFLAHGEPVYENPSPGNRAGGITTLEDKSCGCVQKGGSAPITGVVEYGGTVTARGLNLLDGPGNDLVSATALAAAGAQLILFSTGRGTPFGAPVPTLKIATNSRLAAAKPAWIDFDAGAVATGKMTIDETARGLYDLVIKTAGGQPTCAERHGHRQIAIFKQGVTL